MRSFVTIPHFSSLTLLPCFCRASRRNMIAAASYEHPAPSRTLRHSVEIFEVLADIARRETAEHNMSRWGEMQVSTWVAAGLVGAGICKERRKSGPSGSILGSVATQPASLVSSAFSSSFLLLPRASLFCLPCRAHPFGPLSLVPPPLGSLGQACACVIVPVARRDRTAQDLWVEVGTRA